MSDAPAATETKSGLTLPEWLTVSSSPHLRTTDSVEKIMWTVNASLAPAALWSIYVFHWRAALLIATCAIAAMGTEWIVQKARGVPITAFDGSAFLTGILLAFCVPPTLPLWMAALGSAFAIFIAKHVFGGLGQNVFNPAQIGRAFLLASFPVAMTSWSAVASATGGVDAVTTATPLGLLKEHGMQAVQAAFGSGSEMYVNMFFGLTNGSTAETSAFLLILGGLFLIYKRIISWEGPVVYILTTALLCWFFSKSGGFMGGDPIMAALSGGLMLGGFYMITDYVTTPITRKGQIIFAFFGGVLVWLIREYGGYPEGVCYSILLMNCFTPLIDRLVRPARFGQKAQEVKP
ncbi:MAG: RnfABCDGE type electron transport complex subunit D [Myxococcales bacterium]|nr:MAG: RnfABCDGE type electron transport complex subunit D [Myxococcales bacterium]